MKLNCFSLIQRNFDNVIHYYYMAAYNCTQRNILVRYNKFALFQIVFPFENSQIRNSLEFTAMHVDSAQQCFHG